jgi:hypothetical protein
MITILKLDFFYDSRSSVDWNYPPKLNENEEDDTKIENFDA